MTKVTWSVLFLGLFYLGCASKATDDQLDKMCDNKLKLSGVLRGTVLEEESSRINSEYDAKRDKLKAEMERDLKGMDDVLAGKIKDIEASGEGAKERISAAKEDIEKKKKGITDQFEPLIEKVEPQRQYALNEAKTYVEKRKKEAAEAKSKCVTDAKSAEVSEKTATCRISATDIDAFDACQ